MSKVVSQLQLFVELQKDKLMSDSEFLTYLQQNPSLLTLLSSAHRQGDVTPAIISANVASVISPKGKGLDAAIEINEQFKELALWLIAAGRQFNFSVLGLTDISGPSKPTSDEVEDYPPGFKKFVQKTGGLERAKATIQNIYDRTNSQLKTTVELKKDYGFNLSQWHLSGLMRKLGLRINPRIGGIQKGGTKKKRTHKKFRRNLKNIDLKLKKHPGVKKGLTTFVREQRADKTSFAGIAKKIQKLTGIRTSGSSLSRSVRRMRIR